MQWWPWRFELRGRHVVGNVKRSSCDADGGAPAPQAATTGTAPAAGAERPFVVRGAGEGNIGNSTNGSSPGDTDAEKHSHCGPRDKQCGDTSEAAAKATAEGGVAEVATPQVVAERSQAPHVVAERSRAS